MSDYQTQLADDKMIIKLPSMLNKDTGASFCERAQELSLSPALVYVMDFANVLTIDANFISCFLKFSRQVKKAEKRVMSINLNSRVLSEIKEKGLAEAFGVAQAPAAPAPIAKMDVRLINPFLQSISKVFLEQVSTTLTPEKPQVRTEKQNMDYGIVGLIALSCTSFRGNIALCFPDAVFLGVYERMVGEKHTAVTHEIEDAVAELINIIYGLAKVALNKEQGFDLQPALPSVLRGEKLQLRQQSRYPVIILPFNCDLGRFQVEIAADPNAAEEKRSA